MPVSRPCVGNHAGSPGHLQGKNRSAQSQNQKSHDLPHCGVSCRFHCHRDFADQSGPAVRVNVHKLWRRAAGLYSGRGSHVWWAQEWWFIGLGVIVAAIFSIKQALKRSDKFAYLVDKYLLRAPIVGPIVTNSAIARYCRTLSTTFAAGVPLVEALGSAAGAAGNRLYYDAIKLIQDDVATGQQLQFSMRASGLFPNMVVQMVSIGEESGALDEMLHKAANHYEEAVDNSVDNLTSLMEPMIMSFLGVVIGGLVIMMYLPIFQMGSVVYYTTDCCLKCCD